MITIGNIKAYDLEDLCKMFEAKPDTIRRYLTKGKMRFQKIGKKRFVTERSIRDFLENKKG